MSIAVDLDGTLAEYHGWKGPEHIGIAVPKMLERVKAWIKEGEEVKIFTARIHNDEVALATVRTWLIENGIGALEVTNIKSPDMKEFWDDRAVKVEFNTGEINNG